MKNHRNHFPLILLEFPMSQNGNSINFSKDYSELSPATVPRPMNAFSVFPVYPRRSGSPDTGITYSSVEYA